MDSCIYEGRVSHTRTSPALHRFEYRVFMMYLDLDELPDLFDEFWLWSSSRPAPARFKREKHLGPSDVPLADAVRDRVEAETGKRPSGPVRLLTNLSYFGYWFNPVSFYYCYSADGERIEYIVAEVNNTPWGEQDTYTLECSGENRGAWRFSPTKKMHVSPFIDMNVDYDWVLSAPRDRLSVFMANSRDGKRFFDATMRMERREISAGSLASVLARFPFHTLKVIGAIHWQALKLWLKRCPVYRHPAKNKNEVVHER